MFARGQGTEVDLEGLPVGGLDRATIAIADDLSDIVVGADSKQYVVEAEQHLAQFITLIKGSVIKTVSEVQFNFGRCAQGKTALPATRHAEDVVCIDATELDFQRTTAGKPCRGLP